jgi:TonB family protein
LAVEDSASPDAAVTKRLLARLLHTQGRDAEAQQLAPEVATSPQPQVPNIRSGAGQRPAGVFLSGPTVHPQSSPDAVKVGGGVTAPQVLYKAEPEYSELARAAKYQGSVLLYVEIGPDGKAHNIQVVRSLGLGLDQKAIEAVSQWQFRPGTKDGQPVTVQATIEVNFRLL